MMTQKKRNTLALPVVNPNAAGLDIGATEIYAALPPDRSEVTLRMFGTFTRDLHELADWLIEHGITTVAMESTGVFWIPVFQILEERGLEVCLVNARHVKAVPGRKTDWKDCQWLQHLHAVGLLQASYRPPQDIAAVRSLHRFRNGLTRQAAKQIHLMQKSLTQMNLQLHHVLSSIVSDTGLAIIDAILAGERNPRALAKLRRGRVKASADTIAKALEGDYRPEHLFTLQKALQMYRFTLAQIDECDQEISRWVQAFNNDSSSAHTQAPPHSADSRQDFLRVEMKRAFGIDLFAIPGFGCETVLSVFTEVGTNFSKFRTTEAFASWLSICPNHEKTGGKVKRSHTKQSRSRLATALRQAASSLARQKSFFGEKYRRMRARMGGPKALTALTHRLARLLYHLVTTGQEYDHSKYAEIEERNKRRQESQLRRRAKALGFDIVPT
jgi:transposase